MFGSGLLLVIILILFGLYFLFKHQFVFMFIL